MPQLGPHISIADETLVERALGIAPGELESWPQAVRELATSLAAELFLVRYNPFIEPERVRESVKRRLRINAPLLSAEYATLLEERVRGFLQEHKNDMDFREAVLGRLAAILPDRALGDSPYAQVECATDATDLRIELPMAVLFPESTGQIRDIVRLAGDMGFSLVPRGGGTGATGGAIPAARRSCVLSLSRLKTIVDIDPETKILTAQAGVLTQDAIDEARKRGLLFTVDPASKAASSLGGNVAENAGGPFAFEYGTTIDNVISYTMVTPQAEIIKVVRRNHPRRKIFPDDTVVFDVFGEQGELKRSVTLHGQDIRKPGLGKDVSNKFLGGLPGFQKEGVDGVITEITFAVYKLLDYSQVLCIEFYGRSMNHAMQVIRRIAALRDDIRTEGDLVKISALEEFGAKYVQAIEYQKKSAKFEADPISVLILQLDSDHPEALEDACRRIMDIAEPYEGVDIFRAKDEKEAERFWEDRHKLSAIARRTSGFKVNEDVVIPMRAIPDFADFLENLNLVYLAKSYRRALQQVQSLPGFPLEDDLERELTLCRGILKRQVTAESMSDQELETHIGLYFLELRSRHPMLNQRIEAIHKKTLDTRIVIANHMHAGDGNCHVNLPVNSGDPDMLREAHEAAAEVFSKVLELGGEITGEHGVGITKIDFLSDDKIAALKKYKTEVDPGNVFNPAKLVSRKLPGPSYTFSFNRLLRDLDNTALKDKERLAALLRSIQSCTRCGKCKRVCPMYSPSDGVMKHPRNKNISFGALIEAIYYSQIQDGKPDPNLLKELRDLVEHCTACGKCASVCPIKIDSAGAALSVRAFLEESGQGGHPVKTRVLNWLAVDPSHRIPKTARMLATAQPVHNRTMSLIPSALRAGRTNPLFQGPSPALGLKGLYERLELARCSLFRPKDAKADAPAPVLYFPGCGAAVFSSSIGQAAVYLLLAAGVPVALPGKHLCCGYPLLTSGMADAYETNQHQTIHALQDVFAAAGVAGQPAATILTGCGTCREALSNYAFRRETGRDYVVMDVLQYVLENTPAPMARTDAKLVYHAACHPEFSGLPKTKAAEAYRRALADLLGAEVVLSPGCCGESGLGAMTSPHIYNRIRDHKKRQLETDLADYPKTAPVLVGCPSCRIGIQRSLTQMKKPQKTLHALEYLAQIAGGPKWKKELRRIVRKTPVQDGVRILSLGASL
ncbi:MAG: FAD-binding and (Fe-S)-binding domain-containing protein [Desulfovibrionaceae bacterium]